MKRFFKILAYIFISITLLLGMAIAGVYAFKEPIKNKVTETISNQLTVPVNIKDIKLTVFKNFPLISVSFSKIRAAESDTIVEKPLLLLQRFTVSLNPLSLIRGNYKIAKVELESGEINAAVNGKRNNFSILKADTSASQQKLKLSFNKVSLKDIRLNYYDVKMRDTLSLLVENSEVSGKFSDEEFLVDVNSTIMPVAVRLGGQKITLKKTINFQTSFIVNRPEELYTFRQTKLSVENFNFLLNGKVKMLEKAAQCQLQVLGDNLKLQQLLNLIPKKYVKDIEGFESDGILECRVDINGKLAIKSVPTVKASFKIADGILGKKGIDVKLRNINLLGTLNYQKKDGVQTSSLKLQRFSTIVNGDKVGGSLSLADFSDPFIKANLQGTVNLNQWSKIIKLDEVDTISGLTTIDLDVEGKVADFEKKTEGLPAVFKGNFEAKNVSLAIKGSPYSYSAVSGKLFASNNLLHIDTLNGRINGNTVGIKGDAKNLLNYLFGQGKRLEVEGVLYSPSIDIPSLTATSTAKGAIQKTVDTTGIIIPKNTSFKLKSKIDKVTFNKFLARNVRGTVAVGGGVLTLKNLDFNAMSGSFSVTGNIFNKAGGQFVIGAEMDANQVDINQMFTQCENFGQEQLTAENLEGKLTAHLQLATSTDKNLNINLDKLYAQTSFKLMEGRLYNYKPLLKLSSFVSVEELKDISFDKLENTIEIKDEVINIPSMNIKNSVLNLTAEGFHRFDNYMEYKLRLKLKDLLRKKFNRSKARKENLETDDEGINIFILMKGTPDNLKIRYDRKSVFKKLQKNIKKEKDALFKLLREEFNIKKKDDKANAVKPKEEEDENIPEWETDIPE